MVLLIIFAFLAGVVTVLSPCILPVLPIILSSSDATGKQKPLGVVIGFVASFTFFTLFLSTIVRWSGIPADSLRFLSIGVLTIFGVSLLSSYIQAQIEILFSKFANLIPTGQNRAGFWGGVLIGLSLGLLWTPCVGPILASVISLAITGTVNAQALLITLAYALGTALPMLVIMIAGSTALQKVPWLVKNTSHIQKAFGLLMIATAVGIFFNIDRQFQTFILRTFPNYGVGLTRFEDAQVIKDELKALGKVPMDESQRGKPLQDLMPKGALAPELITGGEWFNSQPLTLSELRGKVVLIDFWTYSCINCQRTMPYLRTWWEKYRDKGLVIIGVHSPEFEFEKEVENVKEAIADFGLTYPIMQDNEFKTWQAYDNRYWPAKYLIDKQGSIRYTRFGEGKYDETERAIQELLIEAGAQDINEPVSNQSYRIYSKTPELYLGSSRIQYLYASEEIQPNVETVFSIPFGLPDNAFAFAGKWTITPEYAHPTQGSTLVLKFEAKEVFLVARPKDNQSGVMKVLVDGQPQFFGEDNQNGEVTVNADKLYTLIKLPAAGKHELKIEFLDDNIEIYAFTFG